MTALALFSGGCDSLISMKLLTQQGIKVIALHFNIGFGGNKNKLQYLQNAATQVGAELLVAIFKSSFLTKCFLAQNMAMANILIPALIAMLICLRTRFISL